MKNLSNEDQELNSQPSESPRPARPALAVRHCADTYKACCVPWGWCHCNCGDCRVAKYAAIQTLNVTERDAEIAQGEA